MRLSRHALIHSCRLIGGLNSHSVAGTFGFSYRILNNEYGVVKKYRYTLKINNDLALKNAPSFSSLKYFLPLPGKFSGDAHGHAVGEIKTTSGLTGNDVTVCRM